MAYDDSNVFAEILRGTASAHVVAEDRHTVAFMDLMPQSEGHTLIVPRAAAENLYDIDPADLRHVIAMTQHVATAVKAAFQPAGVMVIQLNEAGAGQTVFHLHFHVIPRYSGIDLTFHGRRVADAEVLSSHAARIRAEMTLLRGV